MALPFSLDELERVTREAGRIAQRERDALKRELKGDGSIVTNGDRAVETFLRPALKALAPGSEVWGEEFGYDPEGQGGLWAVDPVDGTSNYAYGLPGWGVSIGFIQGPDILAGAIFLPDHDEMALGQKGELPTLNGEPMKPIKPGPIQKYELVSFCDDVVRVVSVPPPGKMRCTGAFVIDGLYTCTQRFRGLVGLKERLYDVAGTVLFAQELGAEIRYVDGTPLTVEEMKNGQQIPKPWIAFPEDAGYFG